MRYSSLLSSLAAVTVLSASATPSLASASTSARNPAPHPQLKTVFAGEFDLASGYNTTGPFGARVHNAMSGGSLWDPTTGEVLADILPFSDDGLSSPKGPFFPNAVIPLVWKGDGHFASFATVGVRGESDHRTWEYAHVETNSPTYSWMNSQFFVLRVNGSAIPHFTFTMYEITD